MPIVMNNMNLPEEDKTLLERWLEDQSFLDWINQEKGVDASKWHTYFDAHPDHKRLIEAAKMLLQGIPFQAIPTHKEEAHVALGKLMNRLEDKQSSKQSTLSVPRRPLWKTWQVAASITVLMILSGIAYVQFFQDQMIELTTPYGQQLQTELPDGSLVTLNANSSLRYHSSNPRKVWLTGEGFFDVAKQDNQERFQVMTQDLTVDVLGTSFNVNARHEQTEVFLEEGKVNLQVDDPKAEIIEMLPGDLIAYSKKQNKLREKRTNASALTHASWKEGALIFNETPLPEALEDIEAIYGIQFVLEAEGVKDELISGGVPIKDLNVTLQTLSEVYGLRIDAEGRRYVIKGKN